ncbi:hypothetical protein AN639_06740 [Candidatus Epulonipiscium fishelsonii]|nr:hypothetical protein AN639_06740 [Epulopiscium sp. SCG-B05WGA-EpuloA1]
MLKDLGHEVLPINPSLVQIISSSNYCKTIKGIRVDCEVSIYRNNVCEKKEFGEVLFTEDGLSGPAIFQISRVASICKKNDESCYVKLDLHPEFNKEQLIQIIYERIDKNPTNSLEQLFIGWINKKIATVIIKNSNVGNINRLCNELEYEEIERLVNSIKSLRFDIVGTRGFKFAQTTIGGISLDDVNLETMESKVLKGLYITGEILDVDGDCGGYNLQWAWSTGYIAGKIR